VALAWPDYGLPTPEVYAAYDRLGPRADGGPGATRILAHLEDSAGRAAPFLFNDLEPAARSVRYNGRDIRKLFAEAGAEALGMTGSGSAYFALADTEAEARRWAAAARAAGSEAVLTTMWAGRGPQQESLP
jgi:4-diphosphocytidyl-2-C-methyl-D-erythritol kinase